MSIAALGTDTYQEQNKSVAAFLFNLTCDTITDISVADMLLMKLTVSLQRNGNSQTLVSGSVWPLGIANNPSSMEGVALTNANLRSVNFRIALPCVINLKGDDRLDVTMDIGATNTGQVATLTTEYGVGIEYYVPRIIVHQVAKQRTTETVLAGNNVVGITLVHSDTEFVISRVNAKGAFWECNYPTQAIKVHIAEQWERQPEHASCVLYEGPPQDNVNIDVDVVTTAAAQGYVVVFGGQVTKTTNERSTKSAMKIAAQTAAKFSGPGAN